MKNKKIILLGAGGHAKSVLDSIADLNEYSDVAILDDCIFDAHYHNINVSFFSKNKSLSELQNDGYLYAFVGVGSVGNTSIRRRLFNELKNNNFIIPNIIDRSAVVSTNILLGEGNYIGKGAVINAFSKIGDCTIINTKSVVEHDCEVGDFSHVSSGSVLCGGVVVGKDTHIGAGSVVRQSIKIGDNSLIGIGSVLTKDIPSNVVAFGSPCRVVKK